MSQENVEVVRAVFDAWNAGDMDGWRELHDPDVIMRNPEGWPEPGPFVGLDAVMRNFEQAREVWDTDTVEPTSDFIDAADRVLVRMIWRGAGHGHESHLEFTIIFTVRKRKVFHIEFLWDHAEALEVVGVSEQAMSGSDVDSLRRGYEAFNRRDMEGLLGFFDPDATWIPSSSAWGAGRTYHGHEGVARLFEDMERDWQEFEVLPDEFRQVGDLILVLGSVRAIPRGGGNEIGSPTAWIWEMREGKALRLQAYTDPRRALEALGVAEQDMNPRETVELAYRATDAFNRRDLDAFVRDFGDLTVAALRARGHGAGSDTPLDERVWQVARWRRGKCVLFRIFNTRAEAFEAMGLSAQAMSENVEIVRAGMEAWNARDMDALREAYAEDVVTWPPTGWPEAGPFVGRDTVVGQWERMRESWEDDEVEMLADYIDAADRVAVRMIWRDRGNGPEAGAEATGIFTIRNGKIRVAEFFWDYSEALATLGLSD